MIQWVGDGPRRMTEPGPRIQVARVDGRVVVTLPTEVDLSNADELRDVGVAAIESADNGAVIVDLGGMTFLDSSGMGALVVMNNAAQAAGKHLLLAHVPAAVERLFAITGLTAAFEYLTEPGAPDDPAAPAEAVDD